MVTSRMRMLLPEQAALASADEVVSDVHVSIV